MKFSASNGIFWLHDRILKGEDMVLCRIWMMCHAVDSISGAEPGGNYSCVMCASPDSWFVVKHAQYCGQAGKESACCFRAVGEILQRELFSRKKSSSSVLSIWAPAA